jgi:plastocyanin
MQAQNYDVVVRNFAFYPALLKINVGDTVTWTNKDDDSHTIRSDPVGGEINSTKLKYNEQYIHTFTQAGNYTYYCSIHAGMRARIIVE